MRYDRERTFIVSDASAQNEKLPNFLWAVFSRRRFRHLVNQRKNSLRTVGSEGHSFNSSWQGSSDAGTEPH